MLNQSLTVDGFESELQMQTKRVELLRSLCLDLRCQRDRKEISTMVRSKYSNNIIKDENDILFVDDIGLKFTNDTLFSLILLGEE